jgi:hypothetical protein
MFFFFFVFGEVKCVTVNNFILFGIGKKNAFKTQKLLFSQLCSLSMVVEQKKSLALDAKEICLNVHVLRLLYTASLTHPFVYCFVDFAMVICTTWYLNHIFIHPQNLKKSKIIMEALRS